MKRIALLALLLLCPLACGPMNGMLPERLSPERQVDIDKGWDNALSPVDRLNRQELLDVLAGAKLFQLGVDHLYFRSEKRFSGGKVIMTVEFDRERPESDYFEISVVDFEDAVLRRESFSREDIETTYRELGERFPARKEDDPPEDPEIAWRRAAQKARWERIVSFFPKPKEKEEKDGPVE